MILPDYHVLEGKTTSFTKTNLVDKQQVGVKEFHAYQVSADYEKVPILCCDYIQNKQFTSAEEARQKNNEIRANNKRNFNNVG